MEAWRPHEDEEPREEEIPSLRTNGCVSIFALVGRIINAIESRRQHHDMTCRISGARAESSFSATPKSSIKALKDGVGALTVPE